MTPTATRTMRLENGRAGRHRPDEDQRSVLNAQLTETQSMVRFCRDRAGQFKRNCPENIVKRRSTTSTPTSGPRRDATKGCRSLAARRIPARTTAAAPRQRNFLTRN
jgi:hypothetical protein